MRQGTEGRALFQKAILESDEQWAQNVKLVDTTGKGLRRSIPARVPFFHVEFGLDKGMAHVIEDADQFPRYFGKVCRMHFARAVI